MLRNLKKLYGRKLAATDGDIGHVKDFYFDDKSWVIRYLIADAGSWLNGRRILLSPHVFEEFDEVDGGVMPINLTRQKIEGSPPVESEEPVSRQYEATYYRYYGLPAYWDGGAMWGLGSYPMVLPPLKEEIEAHKDDEHKWDPHLRSALAVTGYHIQAVDGVMGQVRDFTIDDENWSIHDLVVETGHWYSGKEVQIPPDKVDRISFEERKVYVKLTKSDLQETAA